MKHEWQPGEIFVFESNLRGVHEIGPAREAFEKHGAIFGVGCGKQGNSYAIPTKHTPYASLKLEIIACYVYDFLTYASEHPNLKFFITRIGLMGRDCDDDISILFKHSPDNCRLPQEWKTSFESGRI